MPLPPLMGHEAAQSPRWPPCAGPGRKLHIGIATPAPRRCFGAGPLTSQPGVASSLSNRLCRLEFLRVFSLNCPSELGVPCPPPFSGGSLSSLVPEVSWCRRPPSPRPAGAAALGGGHVRAETPETRALLSFSLTVDGKRPRRPLAPPRLQRVRPLAIILPLRLA